MAAASEELKTKAGDQAAALRRDHAAERLQAVSASLAELRASASKSAPPAV